jgi:hypothetical protein
VLVLGLVFVGGFMSLAAVMLIFQKVQARSATRSGTSSRAGNG